MRRNNNTVGDFFGLAYAFGVVQPLGRAKRRATLRTLARKPGPMSVEAAGVGLPPWRTASLRVPRKSAALLVRGRDAAQRLGIMLDPKGAIAAQLAPAMDWVAEDGDDEMTELPVSDAELDKLAEAYERAMRGFDPDHFEFNSNLAISWWLDGLGSEWSIGNPFALPDEYDQLKMLCTPLFVHAMPPQHPDMLQTYGELAWVIWQHVLPFRIGSLLGSLPDGADREVLPTMLHKLLDGAQQGMAGVTGQMAQFLECSERGKWRLRTLPAADALIDVGERGWNRALEVLLKLQKEPGHPRQHLPVGGTVSLGKFGLGLDPQLAQRVKAVNEQRLAHGRAKAAAAEAAGAAAAVVAAATGKEVPPPAKPREKRSRDGPPPPSTPPEMGGGGGGGGGSAKKAAPSSHEYDGPRPTSHKNLKLTLAKVKSNTSGYMHVAPHNTGTWRAEKRTDHWVGQDVMAPWMAAYEYALWDDAGKLSQESWYAHANYLEFLSEAEHHGLIAKDILRNARAKCLT